MWLSAAAQQKDFEGTVEYKKEVKSKVEGVSDKVMKTILAASDYLTVFIKEGRYLLRSDINDQYYIPKKERVYIKFKAIDTLYYIDYSSDTSTLISVSKSNEEKTIAGQLCKSILLRTSSSSKKYFYSPALYMNPEYDRNNKIDRYDVYTKETSSIWLACYEEGETYSLSYNCSRLEPKTIDESVFELPKLPEKKFSIETLTKAPEFSRSGGWVKYLISSINPEVAAKYLKIPKGEKEATQTVIVRFLISEYGRISNVEVINKKEVHPKLAEEAMRVVSGSPVWKPATIYGQKTIYWYKQPITFQASK